MVEWKQTGPDDRPEQMALRVGKVMIAIGRMAGGTWKISYHLEDIGSAHSYTHKGDAAAARQDAEKRVGRWLRKISIAATDALKELG